jgi:hypothetical protein
MISARININEDTNRLINLVKAKYGLKDKSEAIDKFFELYKDDIDENWEVRKNYLKKLQKIEKEHFKKYGLKGGKTIAELRKEIEG